MAFPSWHGLSQDSGDPTLDESSEERKVHKSGWHGITRSQVSRYLTCGPDSTLLPQFLEKPSEASLGNVASHSASFLPLTA